MNKQKGFLSLTLTALILGTFGVLIRQLAESFSNNGQVFARSLMATFFIVAIVLFKKINPFKLDKTNIKPLLFFSIAFPLSIIFFTISANTIKVSNSLFMLYVGSLASTAILGKFVLKQAFTPKHVFALCLAVIGLCFFVYPFDIKAVSFGLIAGLLSGVFEGTCHILRGMMQNIKREVVVFYQSLSGVVLATALLLVSGEVLVKQFHPTVIIYTVIFGLLLVAIGYLLVYGFGNFDANLGTIILSTELFFALIMNSIFLKEYPTSMELIGGILIFLGSIVTSIDFEKVSRRFSKVN